jgi:hypothetical protein
MFWLTHSLRLRKWHDGLPSSIQINIDNRAQPTLATPAHILVLHAAYHFMLILLNRPWFSRFKSQGIDAHAADSYIPRCERAA